MIAEAHDLWKQFGRLDAVRGASLSVPEGSAFGLFGANGAGKTTLMRILLNVLAPSRGWATVLGIDSRTLGPRQLTRIGYVSENVELPERLPVAAYIAYLRPFYPDWDRDLEVQLLRQFHLPPERRIAHLSHGMRMKLALLCGLAYRPRLLVLDEPFGGIDSLSRDEIMQSVLRQAADTTILLASHDIGEIEGMVTHVGFLETGKMLFQESLEALNARMREIRVTLNRPPALPRPMPPEWLDAQTDGRLLTFMDTRYDEKTLTPRLAAVVGQPVSVEVNAMSLRDILTAYARTAQAREAAA
jgi:ABC-2 type transport system ATP-binding protein